MREHIQPFVEKIKAIGWQPILMVIMLLIMGIQAWQLYSLKEEVDYLSWYTDDIGRKVNASQAKLDKLSDSVRSMEGTLDTSQLEAKLEYEMNYLYGDKIRSLETDVLNMQIMLADIERELYLNRRRW